MSVPSPVRKLNTDLSRMHHAERAEKSDASAMKKAQAQDKAAQTAIRAQEAQDIDAFITTPPPDPATSQKLLGDLFALGEKSVTTSDKFNAQIAKDKTGEAKQKKAAKSEHKQALKDLRPAEYDLSLKATNRDRKELGLKAVSKVIRPPASAGLAKVVSLASRAVALEQRTGVYHYTQDAGGPGDSRTNSGAGVLNQVDGQKISFDCSGFVGALYKEAGLAPPYSTGYAGTSFDVANNPHMQQVSEGQAKPGDVVVFPDHIAVYIGGGKCISMGEEGDPAVVTVAAEAAYHNRGIQGFYHLKGT